MIVRLPGVPNRGTELMQLAQTAAAEAAVVAGVPAPSQRKEPAALLQDIRSALAVIAEALANQQREIAQLRARQSTTSPRTAQIPTQAALTLADLRDRLRVAASSPDEVKRREEPARLGWIMERLNEGLDQLGVVEYQDGGRVDLTRNQVVGHRRADSRHPDGTIASSARSGLLLYGEVLRPQQVVVYVKELGSSDG